MYRLLMLMVVLGLGVVGCAGLPENEQSEVRRTAVEGRAATMPYQDDLGVGLIND